jgi:hypothetical protein
MFFLSKPKKAIIDVNESKQHLRASIIAIVLILKKLSEDIIQHFAISNSKFYKTLVFLIAYTDTKINVDTLQYKLHILENKMLEKGKTLNLF